MLREALIDSESFLAPLPQIIEEDCQHYHCPQATTPTNITFASEDMLVKDQNHNRSSYYTSYVGSTKVERVLINLGSALSIMLVRLIQFLCITINKLASTTTVVHEFKHKIVSLLGKFVSNIRSAISRQK